MSEGTTTELPDEIVELADRLYLTVVLLLRRVRRVDDALGLSSAQLSAITSLVNTGAMTLGELAAAEGVQPPTMTRLAKRLEDEGYVVRRRDPEDGRVTRIRYTTQALMALESGRANRVAAFGDQLARLSDRDLSRLVDALEVLESLSRDPPTDESDG